MTVKIALSALAVAAALAIGSPAFAQDNVNNAPAAGTAPPPAMNQPMHRSMHHSMHRSMHHTMHHRAAHHAMHHAMHHKGHAMMHHAAAHGGMHEGKGGGDGERAETRKLNEQQLHQQ